MLRENDEKFMQHALDACLRGVEEGQTPFGACIVRGGEVVVAEHNRVWQGTDCTAHAEICALREACRLTGSISLAGCTIYSTVEPCPMCFAAIHWARCDRVVFGAGIEDPAGYGFNELMISNEQLRDLAGLSISITGGVMREASLALFERWRTAGRAASY